MYAIINQPGSVCFANEPIVYTISDSSTGGFKTLSFEIGYFVDGDILTTKTIEFRHFPSGSNQSAAYYTIDLSSIIAAYTKKYFPYDNNIVKGYATVKLTKFNGDDITDTIHICLPGISGGLYDVFLNIDIHPILTSRGNEYGSLHFYRSELIAMEAIYAVYPGNMQGLDIYTDDSDIAQELENYKLRIDNYAGLLGVLYKDLSSAQLQLDITRSNAIFFCLNITNSDQRTYIISVQDDPDTDSIYLIRWINSMGAPEALLLTGELQDISEVKRPELYISNQSSQSTERKMQQGTVTTKYSLHTGYLTPARIIALKDMLSSEEIEMQIDGQWVSVSVTADPKHAVHQREPESFELTIEVLEQTRYHKPNRTVRPLPSTRAAFLQDNSGNLILDNNSNTIEENG